jgi:DNA end-binding protein Ku
VPTRRIREAIMRAIWKGYLKCSPVTIPIKMFTAATERPLQFHLYHKACGSRSNQANVCSVWRQTPGPEAIVTGYEYGRDLLTAISPGPRPSKGSAREKAL